MKIFITHGHDEVTKFMVKDFIGTRLSHEPVILGEQTDRQGLTIIEALEKFSEGCRFAVILLTGDDATRDGGKRARQNVIHEIGFFQGRLGRSKVVLVVQKGVEIPSNLAGFFYLEYKKTVKEVFEDLRAIFDAVDASVSAKKLDTARKILVLASSGRFHTTVLATQPLKDLDSIVRFNAICDPKTGQPDNSKKPNGKMPTNKVHYFDFDSGGSAGLNPNTKVSELRSPVVIAVMEGFGSVDKNNLEAAAKVVAVIGGDSEPAKKLIRELIADEQLRESGHI